MPSVHCTISRGLSPELHEEAIELVARGLGATAESHARRVEVHVKVARPRRAWRVVGGRGRRRLFRRRRDALAHADRVGGAVETLDVAPHEWITGRAYEGVPEIASVQPGVRYLVTLKIPVDRHGQPTGRYPRTWRYEQYKTAPPATFASWTEELLHAAAHEGRHIWQFATDAQHSEIDAEHAACAVLESQRAVPRLPLAASREPEPAPARKPERAPARPEPPSAPEQLAFF